MAERLVFVCAQGSARAYLAASLLSDAAGDRFDAWANPSQEEQGLGLVQRVLAEQRIAPLSPDHLIQPGFGMRWDHGIVLCSGSADT
jgi:hypothetical protein